LTLLAMLVAPPSPSAAEAQFRLGKAYFDLGQYLNAAEAFEKGFELQPKPLFLYNAAQAYRKAGAATAALEKYRRFLELDPKAPERAEVQGYIRELEQVAPQPRPPAARPAAAPPPPELDAPSPQALAPAPIVPESPRSPAPRHHRWLWVTIGLAAAGGLAAALALTQAHGVPDTDLGNYRLRGGPP
jgi:tetratricopeptide (TPR) repeat protein